MVLFYIILIIIIFGGAIYNSKHESFMCKNKYKRVRLDNNGKSTYKFLTFKPTKKYEMNNIQTKMDCRYKKQQLCSSDDPPSCLIYRNDNILRCSDKIDMTPNSTCYCDNDCCSNECNMNNNKCVDMIKSNTDTYGYKPLNRPRCRKK